MSGVARPLLEEKQISSFLSSIEFEDYFSNEDNLKRVFSNTTEEEVALAQSITLIREANNDLVEMVENNTFDSDEYRAPPYKTDEQRANLRKEIIEQLTSQIRPDDDELIAYGVGGMLPKSGTVRENKEAFIIIGLPASGKSGGE